MVGLLPLRPFDASLDGFRNDALFAITTLMVSVLFVIVCGILLWAVVMHRQGRHAAVYERGVGQRHLLFTGFITAVIFFGIDGTLLVDAWLDLDQALWRFPRADEHPVEIEIWAQQWSWNARYPGPDGTFNTPDDIVTLNDVHVPLNRPVVLHLRSKDVVHSFYLPNFRIKQDVLPSVETRLWFQASAAGVYEIGCAQHCGASHYRMRGLLTAEPPADFAAWLAAAAADAARKYDASDVEAHWGWPWT
ncbi:MAG: cytochrome c oxidase subunit [Myxococcales bacterium]|nr:cytochrome c oxidase subunit [Myxococcales bacterium]